ncbi:SOH1-domain-containing protein [Dipodascopsis uninucleata]
MDSQGTSLDKDHSKQQETKDQTEIPPSRFEVELEFVQSLSNPQYINFLAQNDYLDDERFINYLEYMEYWRNPEYAKYLIYPNCLHILTLLKHPQFRQDIRHADVAQMLIDDMYAKWLRVGPYRPAAIGSNPAVLDQAQSDLVDQ